MRSVARKAGLVERHRRYRADRAGALPFPQPPSLARSRHTRLCAGELFAGRPILAAAVELGRRIKADFTYEIGATTASTTPSMSFALRRGVCQDFAHIMIAGLRGLGLPAAYVSGYLRTSCGPERPRLEGSDAMHAWVNVWCGAKIGWLGLDPTNAVAAGNDHIVLAIGRD